MYKRCAGLFWASHALTDMSRRLGLRTDTIRHFLSFVYWISIKGSGLLPVRPPLEVPCRDELDKDVVYNNASSRSQRQRVRQRTRMVTSCTTCDLPSASCRCFPTVCDSSHSRLQEIPRSLRLRLSHNKQQQTPSFTVTSYRQQWRTDPPNKKSA